jgi:hypothetical protein
MLAFQEFISAREVLPFVPPLNYLGHNVFHMIIFLPLSAGSNVADGTALKKYELCL